MQAVISGQLLRVIGPQAAAAFSCEAVAFPTFSGFKPSSSDEIVSAPCLGSREAPLHEGHLGAMQRLARLGAVIAPSMPPFHAKPTTVEDMVREIAARLINWAGIDPGNALTRWGEA
mgnify:CR=1 FL=1